MEKRFVGWWKRGDESGGREGIIGYASGGFPGEISLAKNGGGGGFDVEDERTSGFVEKVE